MEECNCKKLKIAKTLSVNGPMYPYSIRKSYSVHFLSIYHLFPHFSSRFFFSNLLPLLPFTPLSLTLSLTQPGVVILASVSALDHEKPAEFTCWLHETFIGARFLRLASPPTRHPQKGKHKSFFQTWSPPLIRQYFAPLGKNQKI